MQIMYKRLETRKARRQRKKNLRKRMYPLQLKENNNPIINKSLRILYFRLIPRMLLKGDESFSCGGKEKQQVETDEASLFTVSLKQLLLHQQVALAAFGCFLLRTGVNLGKRQRRRRRRERKEKKWPAAKQLCRTCWVSCWTVMGGAGFDYCPGSTPSCPLGPLRSFVLYNNNSSKRKRQKTGWWNVIDSEWSWKQVEWFQNLGLIYLSWIAKHFQVWNLAHASWKTLVDRLALFHQLETF